MQTIIAAVAITLLAPSADAFAGDPVPEKPPTFARVPLTPPDRAEKTMRTQAGFRMELIAAEPLIASPVVLEYDADGRGWVAEMRDYPYTDKSTDKPNVERTTDVPLGRIRVLEDTNGDGRFDRSTIFAEGLSWPTGIAFWKRGVYVAATPDLWYLEDTDGDLKADIRRKVYAGFRKFNVQAVINNLKWGLDHRIYGAGSSNGGKIVEAGKPERTPSILGRNDFRFSPGDERFELISGGARFGNCFDDWGNRFLCNIRNPVQHVVLESRYLERNPYFAVTTAVADVAESGDQIRVFRASPPEPWRTYRAQRWVEEGGHRFPRSELTGDGFFTSASGVTVYRGDAYPPVMRGQVFVAEVAGNIIHRQAMEPEGATFRSKRIDQGVEFVASTDNWFRPVNFTNAPDGTLHIVDMYRETIEHPWSIPDDIKAQLDLESGRESGRIYRLAPPGFRQRRTVKLSGASTAELVALLESDNGWTRDTAHRLIYERQDTSAVSLLRKLARESQSALARMHALYSLDGLGYLSEEDLKRALFDRESRVREHAIKLAEPRLKERPALAESIQVAWIQPGRERFQAALSFGNDLSENSILKLSSVVEEANVDSWTRSAVLSAKPAVIDELLEFTLDAGQPEPHLGDWVRDLATIVGAEGNIARIRELIDLHSDYQLGPMVVGFDRGMRSRGKSLQPVLASLAPTTRRRLDKLIAAAISRGQTIGTSAAQRISDIDYLRLAEFSVASPILRDYLAPQWGESLQKPALVALAGFTDSTVGPLLLESWKSAPPSLRAEIVEALLARKERVLGLLRAIEQKQIPAAEISTARRELLLKHPDQEIRAVATRALAATSTASRAAVVARYQAALSRDGQSEAGRRLFEQHCSACHRLGGMGQDVGPNLSTVRTRTRGEIMLHVLDPNREVAPNFVEYVVTTTDGRTLSGIVTEESPTSLTLKRKAGAAESVLRSEVDELTSTGKSLMPEGIENLISPAQMADLLAFVLPGAK